MVDVHIDRGNTDRNWLLGIAHFLLDIIPYEIFCLHKIRRLNNGMIYEQLKQFRENGYSI